MRKKLTIVGAATDLGQRRPGTEMAPSWLRLKKVFSILNNKFHQIEDVGDLSTHENQLPEEVPSTQVRRRSLARYNFRLKEVCTEYLMKQNMIFTIGGDHSISIGTLAASLSVHKDIKVVWVDAHGDLNTTKTSPSGNLHGMPLAFFLNLIENPELKLLFDWVPKLEAKNIVYIGLRDVDPGEKSFISSLGIKAFYAQDVHQLGIDAIMEETLYHLKVSDKTPIHLSLDVDGLDPEFFPATGTPVPGGLHLKDGQTIIKTLATRGDLVSFDFVEINPLLAEDPQELEVTVESAKKLLESLPDRDEQDIFPSGFRPEESASSLS